jgi:hypothetical protein
MDAHDVSPVVNSAKYDGPELKAEKLRIKDI